MSGFEVVGALASALTVAEVVLKTVKTVQNAFHAVRDAPIELSDETQRLDLLSTTLLGVRDSLKQRHGRPQSASEERHCDAVVKVLRNCNRDLKLMQKELPRWPNTSVDPSWWSHLARRRNSRFAGNITTAWELYRKENDRRSARLQKNLEVLQWSIFTILFPKSWDDGPSSQESALMKMREIPPENDFECNLPFFNTRALPTVLQRGENGDIARIDETELKDCEDIKTWKNSWIVLSTTVLSTRDIPEDDSGSDIEHLSALHQSTDSRASVYSPHRTKWEVEIEFQENQKIVQHFQKRNLQAHAAIHQKKGIAIKKELEDKFEERFEAVDRAGMDQRLAQILLATKSPGCKEEARGILERLLSSSESDNLAASQKNDICYTLGKLYFGLGQDLVAIQHLRIAFYGYRKMLPTQKTGIREIVMEISDTICNAYHALGDSPKARVWKLKARKDLDTDYVQPKETLRRAVEWCQKEHFNIRVDISREFPKPSVLFDLIFDEKDNSPLHKAASDPSMDPEVFQEMLHHVDSLEGRNANGDTPLLIAVTSSNRTVVEQLLRRFANIHVRSRGRPGRPEERSTVLHRCKDTAIARLLVGHLKLTRKPSVSKDPLDRETSLDDQEVINIDTMDNYGVSPLQHACKTGNVEMVSFLLLHQADPNLYSPAHGRPLDCALDASGISKGDKKAMVHNLVDKGASLSLKGKHKRTYTSLMEKQGFTLHEIKKMKCKASSRASHFESSRDSSFSATSTRRTSSITTALADFTITKNRSGYSLPPGLHLDIDETDIRFDI